MSVSRTKINNRFLINQKSHSGHEEEKKKIVKTMLVALRLASQQTTEGSNATNKAPSHPPPLLTLWPSCACALLRRAVRYVCSPYPTCTFPTMPASLLGKARSYHMQCNATLRYAKGISRPVLHASFSRNDEPYIIILTKRRTALDAILVPAPAPVSSPTLCPFSLPCRHCHLVTRSARAPASQVVLAPPGPRPSSPSRELLS